jgi:hypothetical protein
MTTSAPITREQLAWLIARYFPQVVEFQNRPQIVTDLQGSWARPEIQTVLGVGILDSMPNHTFQPARTAIWGEFVTSLARLSRMFGLRPAESLPEAPLGLAPDTALQGDMRLAVSLGLVAFPDPRGLGVSKPLSGQEAVNAAEKLLHLMEKNRR